MDFFWKGKAVKETKFWKTVYVDSRHMSATDFHWETMVCVLHGFSLGESENPLYEKLMDFSALQGPLDYVDFSERMKRSSYVPEMLGEIRTQEIVEIIECEDTEQAQEESKNEQDRLRLKLSKLMQKREEKLTSQGILALMGNRRNILFDFWEERKDLQKFMFELWAPFVLASETENSYDLEKTFFPSVLNPYVESDQYNRTENPYEVKVKDVLDAFKKSTQVYPAVNTLKNVRSILNGWFYYNERRIGSVSSDVVKQVVEVLVSGLEDVKNAGHQLHGYLFGDRMLSAWLRRAVVFSEQKKGEDFFLFERKERGQSILERLNAVYDGDPINSHPYNWLAALFIRKEVTGFSDQLMSYINANNKRRSNLLKLEMGELLNRYAELGVDISYLNPEIPGDKNKLDRVHQVLNNDGMYFFDYVGHEKNIEMFYPKIKEEEWVEERYIINSESGNKKSSFEKFFVDKNLLRSELGFKETIATFTNLLRHTESVSKPVAEQWREIVLREIQTNPLIRSQISKALENTFESLCEQERVHPNTVRPVGDVRLLFLKTLMDIGVSLVSPDPEIDFLCNFLKGDGKTRLPFFLSKAFAEDPAIYGSAFFKNKDAFMVLEKTLGSHYLKQIVLKNNLHKDVRSLAAVPSFAPPSPGLNRF